MATKIEPNKWMLLLQSVVVFDLEFVGDINDPESCGLWEIGATALATGDSFEVIVDPEIFTIPKPQEGCFDLSHAFLEEYAVPLKRGLQMFVSWASKYRIFVSHNCFKSDISVLRGAFRKCDLKFPTFLFIDSLMLLRQHIKLKNYKLGCVYQYYMNREMTDNHRALPDAKYLKEILIAMGPLRYPMYAYPMTLTSLQNIKGIGHSCESTLIDRGVFSVEDLQTKILTTGSSILLWQDVTNSYIIHFVLNQFNLPVQDLQQIHDDILWRINKMCNIVEHGD